MNTIQKADSCALSIAGIGKSFPGVRALDNVSLDLNYGEIHAVMGENGAGKSTIIKILTGVYRPDEGSYAIDGKPVSITRPKDAIDSGVAVVPQDVLLVPQLTIGRNILLGFEGRSAFKDKLSLSERQRVEEALARVGADFSPDTRTSDLSVAHMRLAQIARALIQPGNILILDEPTAVLSEHDAELLLARLEALRDGGKAILYVSHRLGEVMRLADRVTVLRDGRHVGQFKGDDIERDAIVTRMAKDGVKKQATARITRRQALKPHAYPRIKTEEITAGRQLADVNFEALPGEIVGVAGVQGSGHGSLLSVIFGLMRADKGNVLLDGEVLDNPSCVNSVRLGMLLVPADRRGAAIVPPMSLRENLALGPRLQKAARRMGLRWHKIERDITQSYIDRLTIRPGSTEAKIGTMSGGNQQKLAIARAIEGKARVILIEEPTQGVDVGAKAEIHDLLRTVAYEEGATVIVASSEFEELLDLADRIYVMRAGRLVGQMPAETATYRDILELAL